MCFLSSFETIFVCHLCNNPCLFLFFFFKASHRWSLPSFDISFSYARIHIYNHDLCEFNCIWNWQSGVGISLSTACLPQHFKHKSIISTPSYCNEIWFSSLPLITQPGENGDFGFCVCFCFFITTKSLMLIQSEFFRIVFLFLNSNFMYILLTNYDS